MKAEIITIGDELLIGQVLDSNSAFISKALTKIGVEVRQITTISDRREHILKSLKEASSRVDIVLVTGGLGPTNDDVTKLTFADYFKDSFVVNQDVLTHIKTLFSAINTPVLPANLSQAKLPSKAEALTNRYGTAPGMWFEETGCVYVALPGVPYEMKALMQDEVIPRLKEKFDCPYILYETVLTYGMGESEVAHRLKDWEAALPAFMSLAYLPAPGKVRLRLTAKGRDKSKLEQALKCQLKTMENLIGTIVKGYEGMFTLPEQIANQLTDKHETLAVAESCTGGKIATLFTAIPGASRYFKGAIVPYFTEAKTNVLEVDERLIKRHSVVSAEVAKAMALQVSRKFGADYGLATTGNAGPTKGDSEASLGTVYIALACENTVKVEAFHLGNHREKVVGKAVAKALEILFEAVK